MRATKLEDFLAIGAVFWQEKGLFDGLNGLDLDWAMMAQMDGKG